MMDRTWNRRVFAFNQTERDLWVAAQAALIPAGARVLDAGAGRAPYRELFAHCRYFTQDFGMEPTTVGEYAQLDFECDITSIPSPDGSFDVILCTEVLEHVSDPALVFTEFRRLLASGGRVLLTAPLGSHLHQEPYHYYGGFTPYWYEHFLRLAGFRVTSLERNRGFFSFFGQEAQRFSSLVDPRNTRKLSLGHRIVLSSLWLLTLPMNRLLFPLLGRVLDNLHMEQSATVGYHVVAVRT